MRLYEEIFKDVDGVFFARCSVIPRGGGYFEGVKAVEDFSDEPLKNIVMGIYKSAAVFFPFLWNVKKMTIRREVKKNILYMIGR